jgi:hypothetical protein
LELTLLSLISSQIPTITLPPYPQSLSSATSFASMPAQALESTSTILLGPTNPSPTTASSGVVPFRPRNTLELRSGLFRNPATLKGLRVAAADRFAHWREIKQACGALGMTSFPTLITEIPPKSKEETDREKSSSVKRDGRKKLEWELRLSRDVAVAFNSTSSAAATGISRKGRSETTKVEQDSHQSLVLDRLEEGLDQPSSQVDEDEKKILFEDEHRPFLLPSGLDEVGGPDPLHLPTLVRLSAALLGAFGRRLVSSLVQQRPAGNHHVDQDEKWRQDEDEGGWSLTKWGIAGIAFAIGYCAGRLIT